MPKPLKSSSIEIFRAGTHVDMHGRECTFTSQDLVDLAAGYSPATSEAPVVVGHPKTNGPAYGWVTGLKVEGDVLTADLGQVDQAFADMVREGRFKKRSASFFLPDSKDNPTPGKFYLRHVGFLGAAAPAVKGLREVDFSGGDAGTVEFVGGDRRWAFRVVGELLDRVRDYLIDKEGLEKADQVISPWQIDSLKEAAQPDNDDGRIGFTESTETEDDDVSDKTAAFAARETELNEREAAIAADEKRVAERKAKERRDDAVSFVNGLVEDGRLLPKNKPAALVEVLLALPIEAPVSFADGDDQVEKPAAEVLREFLGGLPKQIEFSERSGVEEIDAGAASFAAPAGSHVDAAQLELHRKAKAYQAKHPNTSFIAAVKAVGG